MYSFSPQVLRDLLKAAKDDYPFETCGLLFSRKSQQHIQLFVRTENIFHSSFMFGIHKREFKKIVKKNDEFELRGVFHSHPVINHSIRVSRPDIDMIKSFPNLVFLVSHISPERHQLLVMHHYSNFKQKIISKEIRTECN